MVLLGCRQRKRAGLCTERRRGDKVYTRVRLCRGDGVTTRAGNACARRGAAMTRCRRRGRRDRLGAGAGSQAKNSMNSRVAIGLTPASHADFGGYRVPVARAWLPSALVGR